MVGKEGHVEGHVSMVGKEGHVSMVGKEGHAGVTGKGGVLVWWEGGAC